MSFESLDDFMAATIEPLSDRKWRKVVVELFSEHQAALRKLHERQRLVIVFLLSLHLLFPLLGRAAALLL